MNIKEIILESKSKPRKKDAKIEKEKYIVAKWLKDHGYDGLYCELCQCAIDGVISCDGCNEYKKCKAGVWNIGARKGER